MTKTRSLGTAPWKASSSSPAILGRVNWTSILRTSGAIPSMGEASSEKFSVSLLEDSVRVLQACGRTSSEIPSFSGSS